jgi:hypothetical protein
MGDSEVENRVPECFPLQPAHQRVKLCGGGRAERRVSTRIPRRAPHKSLRHMRLQPKLTIYLYICRLMG